MVYLGYGSGTWHAFAAKQVNREMAVAAVADVAVVAAVCGFAAVAAMAPAGRAIHTHWTAVVREGGPEWLRR